jgi:hypothetical protein
MKFAKLLRHLGDYLNKDKNRSKADLEKADQLLKRLKHRREQLRLRLEKEKRACKQQRMKLELKIVEAKLKKAKERQT